MENKLQQAKDTIAKNYRRNNWQHFKDMSASGFGGISEKMLEDVAIEYNRLCNEWISVDEPVNEEIIDEQLILVLEYLDYSRLTIVGYFDGYEFRNLETGDVFYNVILYKPLPQPPTK